MSMYRELIKRVILGGLLFNASFSSFSESLTPVSLYGKWQIRQVEINNSSTRRLNYQFNDPRLVGRVLDISANRLSSNFPEDGTCLSLSVSSGTETINSLISKISAGDKNTTAKDYELSIDGNRIYPVEKFSCKSGYFGPGVGNNDNRTWFFIIDRDTLLTNWFDLTIIKMNRLPQKPTPVASFNCKNAQSKTERAICQNFDLAAWDNSVNKTWILTKELQQSIGNRDNLRNLHAEQVEWLKNRNKCGSDERCLTKIMEIRIEQLMSMNTSE